MMPLPEVYYFTVADAAFTAAEELSQAGFAVEIINDGNIYKLKTKEIPCSKLSLRLPLALQSNS